MTGKLRVHLSAIAILSLHFVACGGSDGESGAMPDGPSSGGPKGDGPSGDGPSAIEPIPVSSVDFDLVAIEEDAALERLVGEHDVAIYFTPEGQESSLGPGTIEVALDASGDVIRLALKNGSGDVLVEVQNSRKNPENFGQAAFTKVLGKILVDQRDSEYERIDVTFRNGGTIDGYVGGSGQYFRFRNNVLHYGPTLPSHLVEQVGTWSGPQLASTCDQPPVTIEVDTDGTVVMSGKSNLDCMEGTVTNQWDGQDDFVAPAGLPGTAEIVLDSYKGGGSQAPGGIWLTVSATPAEGVFLAKTTLEGARGALEVSNPVKQ